MSSPELDAPATNPPPSTRPHWFFGAYAQIAVSILLSAASQIFMKLGADEAVGSEWLGVSGLRSGWVWLGILALIASLVSWLHALRTVPLNIAFTLTAATHALIPLSCWLFLGEMISGKRWCGIALVLAGVFVVARPLVRVEEKL